LLHSPPIYGVSIDKIRKGVLVKPVVFFSDWLGIVLTEPKQYEPTEDDEELAAITFPPFGAPYWDGVLTVQVYWFSEGIASEEFIDFLQIVSPPEDALDHPGFFERMEEFYWTDEEE